MTEASGRTGDLEILPASDRSLLVLFGRSIGFRERAQVLRLLSLLDAEPCGGVVDLTPAYASVLLRFDPLATDHARVERHVRALLPRLSTAPLPEPRLVEIPVCYGGEYAPDLESVARFGGITPDQAIALHSGTTYDVHFLGFSPGFAYMGTVPSAIACPRLDTPRIAVPAGSVGIAGDQTGVYPQATPGGWRIIGRTPLLLFDPAREPMSRILIGDQVRFIPIAPESFPEPHT